VQVIFSLPSEYGNFEHPLAYVEWFTLFNAPVPDLEMYQVSRSTQSHRHHTSIILVSQIERSVHLILKFGQVMDVTWSADNILEVCKTFFVNPYVRHLDFLLLCYLVTWLCLLDTIPSIAAVPCIANELHPLGTGNEAKLYIELTKLCTVGAIVLWDHNNLQWRTMEMWCITMGVMRDNIPCKVTMELLVFPDVDNVCI